MNSSDSQSFTDENREDISIDQSSDCESYSKGSQQSSSKLVKKNNIDASSSNSSSFKSSNKTCSEKIFVPTFQFVNVPKDEDMDQKSQSSSSDESLGSFAKKSAKKSIKKTEQQSVKLSNKKRAHCYIASAATNTQDTKMESAA